MTKASPMTSADIYMKLDKYRLFELGVESFTLIPQEMIIRRKRVTYRISLERDDEGNTLCRVVYDGCRRRILVTPRDLQEALEAIWNS